MKRLNVFLSSAMTGELALERSGLQLYFKTDPTLQQFADLYVIEEHASPHPIEKAYVEEVRDSQVLVLLLDKELRPAVQKEFHTAKENNVRPIVFIRERTDQRDAALANFISDEAYQFQCAPFTSVNDLCEKVKDAIINDLLNTYRRTAPQTSLPPPFVHVAYSPTEGNPLFTPAELDAMRSNPQIASLDSDQLVTIAMLQSTEKWDYRTGLMLLELAIGKDPNNWMAFHNKGQLLADIGLNRDALLWYERVLELNPHSHPTLHNIGIHHYRAGDNAKAKEYFTRALLEMPNKISSLSYLVNIAFAEKNYLDAEAYARRAVSIKPGDLERANLAYALALNGKIEEARTELAGWNVRSKEFLRASSYVEELADNITAAIALLDEFTKTFGVERQVCVKKSYLLIDLQRYSDARTWLNFVQKHVPLSAADYNNLAYAIIQKKGDLLFAAELLEKSLCLDSSLVVAWCNLQLCYDSDDTREKGLDVARRAFQRLPNEPSIANNLGHALMLSGHIQEYADFIIERGVNVGGGNLRPEQKEDLRQQMKSDPVFSNLPKLEKLFRDFQKHGKDNKPPLERS